MPAVPAASTGQPQPRRLHVLPWCMLPLDQKLQAVDLQVAENPLAHYACDERQQVEQRQATGGAALAARRVVMGCAGFSTGCSVRDAVCHRLGA